MTTEQVDTPTAAMRAALSILDAEHRGFATVLRALSRHLELVRTRPAATNHDLLSTILGYADSFMERFHHPKEDEYLFRALRSRTDEADEALLELQHEHATGPADAPVPARGARPFARWHRRTTWTRSPAASSATSPSSRRTCAPRRWSCCRSRRARSRPPTGRAIERAFRGHTDPFFGAGPLGALGRLLLAAFRLRTADEA